MPATLAASARTMKAGQESRKLRSARSARPPTGLSSRCSSRGPSLYSRPRSRVSKPACTPICTNRISTDQTSSVSSKLTDHLPGLRRKGGSEAPPSDCLKIEHQTLRILEAFLDAHQERHRFLAVDDPVIIGQRQIHHRA